MILPILNITGRSYEVKFCHVVCKRFDGVSKMVLS